MTKTEFQAFVVAGAIDQVVISRPNPSEEWELWVHVPGYRGSERFHTARGDLKKWSWLATVYSEVRSMDYVGPIVVEG